MNIFRFKIKIILVWMVITFIPLTLYAGTIDIELKRQLGHTSCITSWNYNESAFHIYFAPNNCNKGELSAAVCVVRYIFESNNAKFPKNIIVHIGSGEVQTYPFERIPTLIIK